MAITLPVTDASFTLSVVQCTHTPYPLVSAKIETTRRPEGERRFAPF